MARLPRLYLPGYPLHLVVRGNDRQDIFRSDGDRIFFHRCLVEATRRHGVDIHAYVFMSNHVHLLATGARRDSVAKLVQSMGRRYVSYFNYLYKRTGTLWEGRYHSCIVQTDRYLLGCYRYIEMNPVRAGIAAHPDGHRWSSHACNAHQRPDDLVTPHPLFLGLASSHAARRTAYLQLFERVAPDEETAAIRHALSKGWALGDDAFRDRLEQMTGRRGSPRRRGRKGRRPDAINSIGV